MSDYIIETPETAEARPLFPDNLNFLPSSTGEFKFPAPWDTRAWRLTAPDVTGTEDNILHAGYSYWMKMNYHRGEDEILILLRHSRQRGGGGPSIIRFNKVTGDISPPEPLFPLDTHESWLHGEDFYWSLSDPYVLYYAYERSFNSVNVLTGQVTPIFSPANGDKVRQAHSSADGKVHSMTLQTGDYRPKGAVVYFQETGEVRTFPQSGFDECQIDKSGRWLVIKAQVDGKQGEDNRVIDLETGDQFLITDPEGAAGHSDMGYGYMVNADNFGGPGHRVVWDFETRTKQLVSWLPEWGNIAMNHLSHCNARRVPAEEQVAFGSAASRSGEFWSNEIMAFKLDGSGEHLAVAPTMIEMDGRYSNWPFANCDYSGRYVLWSSNMGDADGRKDWFLAEVPLEALTGEAVPDPTPEPEPTPDPEPEPVDCFAQEARIAELENELGLAEAAVALLEDELDVAAAEIQALKDAALTPEQRDAIREALQKRIEDIDLPRLQQWQERHEENLERMDQRVAEAEVEVDQIRLLIDSM